MVDASGSRRADVLVKGEVVAAVEPGLSGGGPGTARARRGRLHRRARAG